MDHKGPFVDGDLYLVIVDKKRRRYGSSTARTRGLWAKPIPMPSTSMARNTARKWSRSQPAPARDGFFAFKDPITGKTRRSKIRREGGRFYLSRRRLHALSR